LYHSLYPTESRLWSEMQTLSPFSLNQCSIQIERSSKQPEIKQLLSADECVKKSQYCARVREEGNRKDQSHRPDLFLIKVRKSKQGWGLWMRNSVRMGT
jgi:hypothetical protein